MSNLAYMTLGGAITPTLGEFMAHDDTLRKSGARVGVSQKSTNSRANLSLFFLRDDGSEMHFHYDAATLVRALRKVQPDLVDGMIDQEALSKAINESDPDDPGHAWVLHEMYRELGHVETALRRHPTERGFNKAHTLRNVDRIRKHLDSIATLVGLSL